jgi:hypothetical protein
MSNTDNETSTPSATADAPSCDSEDFHAEVCAECDEYMGGRNDWTEEEFDEHPDRKEGYDENMFWHCPKCREKKED